MVLMAIFTRDSRKMGIDKHHNEHRHPISPLFFFRWLPFCPSLLNSSPRGPASRAPTNLIPNHPCTTIVIPSGGPGPNSGPFTCLECLLQCASAFPGTRLGLKHTLQMPMAAHVSRRSSIMKRAPFPRREPFTIATLLQPPLPSSIGSGWRPRRRSSDYVSAPPACMRPPFVSHPKLVLIDPAPVTDVQLI